MKKISILAMAALFLAACNQDGQTIVEDEGGNALLFNATTNVPTTRATYGAINTNALMASGDGFGVFAYHNGQTKSPAVETEEKAANFMFNQQVHYTGSWIYSPLKYWPNETGANAESVDKESLSFLAYAPHISATAASSNKDNEGGIVGISTNDTPFDNIAIDYQVAQNPQKQVDLLWGVGNGSSYDDVEGASIALEDGMPLYNLTKPKISYKVPFLFKHALSKLNLTIDAIVDAVDGNTNPVANNTKIFVRKVTLKGNLATEGKLMLKNTEANKPEWKAIGGGDLAAPADGLVLNDGRKQDKEATTEDSETFACLNSMIIQNDVAFGGDNNNQVGVTNATVSLLKPAEDGTASLMVIPVPVDDPTTSKMEVTIEYDVLTFDENLGVELKDASGQKGSTVTNIITKTIDGFAFDAGKEYTINMHLGMNSVKFDAKVSDWVDNGANPVDLPTNDVASNATDFELSLSKISVINDEASYNAAWNNGLSTHYAWLDANYPHPIPDGANYNDLTTEWDNNDSRHHSWASYVKLCEERDITGQGVGFKAARILFNLEMTPALNGTITAYYNEVEVFSLSRNYTTSPSYPFLLADITEFVDPTDPDEAGVNNFGLGTFDKSKLRVVIHRNE